MKTRFFRKTRYIRRTVQAACLLLFCGCIAAAVGSRPDVPVNVFLRLDPLVTALVPVAVREWIPTLWPGLIVLASALLLGRFFCGRVCPMGTTLDLVRAILLRLFGSRFRKKNTPHDPNQKNPHSPKYLLLAACAGAALLGVNLIHWFSPIALITRLYALLLHSLGLLFAGHSLEWLRPSPAAVAASGSPEPAPAAAGCRK